MQEHTPATHLANQQPILIKYAVDAIILSKHLTFTTITTVGTQYTVEQKEGWGTSPDGSPCMSYFARRSGMSYFARRWFCGHELLHPTILVYAGMMYFTRRFFAGMRYFTRRFFAGIRHTIEAKWRA